MSLKIGLFYLNRKAEGSFPVKRFLDSYKEFNTGISHELITIYKGFNLNEKDIAQRLFEGIENRHIDVDDDMTDIDSYLIAAKSYSDIEVMCFLNTFSEIVSHNWLLKLFNAISINDVGIAGASASYESMLNSVKLNSKVVWLCSNNFLKYDREVHLQQKSVIDNHAPNWIPKDINLSLNCSSQKHTSNFSGIEKYDVMFEEYWEQLTKDDGVYAFLNGYPTFPNPHIRSNGFIIRRVHLLPFFCKCNKMSKKESYLFESGFDSLTRQILKKNLRAVLVNNRGDVFDIDKWPESQTFRLKDQQGLLIHDNQTRKFQKFNLSEKIALANMSWGNSSKYYSRRVFTFGIPFEFQIECLFNAPSSQLVTNSFAPHLNPQPSKRTHQNSISLWLTKPIRGTGMALKKIKRVINYSGALLFNLKELKKSIVKLKNNGPGFIENSASRLQSEEYAAQLSRDRGLSPTFIKALVVFGNVFVKINKWWFANSLRKKYTINIALIFLGRTEKSRNIELSHFRIFIENPRGLFKIVNKSFIISGWGVNLEAKDVAEFRVRIGKGKYQPYQKPRGDVQQTFSSVCDIPLETGFSVPLELGLSIKYLLPIGLHRMWIDVKDSNNNWIPVRRALLFRVPEIAFWKRKRLYSYATWAHIEQKLLETELPNIKQHINVMIQKPIFTVIIDTRQNLLGVKKTLESLRKQIYPHYKLRTLAGDGDKNSFSLGKNTIPLNDLSIDNVSGDFIVFIESGQCLANNALYEFANAINQDPDLDLIYGDKDHINSSGKRCNPFYKPTWSPDYLETFNYIGFPTCFRTSIAKKCFENAELYDLVLQFTEHTTKILHVEKILGHDMEREMDNEALDLLAEKNIASLKRRLKRTGRKGTITEHKKYRGCYDIQLDLKRKPLVSVIIPTAGKTVTVEGRSIDLITNIVDQIRNKSTYKKIEIIVVDNGDLSKKQQKKLIGQSCRLVTFKEGVFNIAKKFNLGASIAKGKLLLLMNDDIEVISSSWIERMVEHFEKPHVGVVGAKLLYPNGQTQHVGVVHNYGNPAYVRRNFPRDEAGYYFSTCGVHNFVGVSGVVMMTLRNVYRKVDGFSKNLATSYNDTDYCLKVQKLGFGIVYAPKVELIHFKSQSQSALLHQDQSTWYQKQWAPNLVSDPYYNEQFLSITPPTFIPCVNQRIL